MTIDESDAPYPIGFAGGGYYESAALLAASLFKAPCAVIRVDAEVPETFTHASPRAAGYHYSTAGYVMDAAGQLVQAFMQFALADMEPANDEPPLAEFMRCPLVDKAGQPLGMLMLFDCAGRPPLTPRGKAFSVSMRCGERRPVCSASTAPCENPISTMRDAGTPRSTSRAISASTSSPAKRAASPSTSGPIRSGCRMMPA